MFGSLLDQLWHMSLNYFVTVSIPLKTLNPTGCYGLTMFRHFLGFCFEIVLETPFARFWLQHGTLDGLGK